jgi:hypothetical protein
LQEKRQHLAELLFWIFFVLQIPCSQ